jgi:DNA repair protein RAD50
VSISSRCAELDAEIPNQLGVSKAILENVIFCHQEEASWPLAEPSILKKKFDDIFAATKYTKALDELKSIKKDKGLELKLDQQRLEFLKTDVEKSKRVADDWLGSISFLPFIDSHSSGID